jgi:Tol biopolymer transport system component
LNASTTRTTSNALRRLNRWVLASVTIAMGFAAAPAAHATYPGSPGVIIFGAFGEGQADLWSSDPDGSGLSRLTNTADVVDICPAVSGDGRRVASCRNAGDGFEIWTSDVGGGNDRQLTDLGGWATFPDWNPQGNRIVFSWAPTPESLSNLYVVHARSGKVKPLLVEDGYAHENPVYSPDGRSVLYVRERWELDEEGFPYPVEGQLWLVDLSTGTQHQLTFDDTIKGQTPDWSPDGTRIAYAAGGDGDIWIMNADGTDQRNLTNTPDATEFGTAFSPDGRWIAFTGLGGPVPDGERYVQVMRTDGSERRIVVETPGLRQAVPAWQPVSSRTK